MNKSHLIIAGTNKAGTTSLFRYLADHPNVSPSHVKELRYFLNKSPQLDDYLKNFKDDTETRVYLEASPQYLDAGDAVARRIQSILPNVQLFFLLRNPIDRLRSFFNSFKSRQDKLVGDLDFEQFSDLAIASVGDDSTSSDHKEFRRELLRGCYAQHLSTYLNVFDAKQLHVIFFDDLQRDAESLVKHVCEQVDLNSAHFDAFEFAIENRTRHYRSGALHSIAHRLNVSLESFFNRHRGVKVWVRSLYTRFNETKTQSPITNNPPSLEEYYGQRNTQLRQLLEKRFPHISLPLWLKQSSSTQSRDSA